MSKNTEEQRLTRETLLRLSNSCLRAAARGQRVSPIGADLDEEDYRSIARILRGLAVEPTVVEQ